MVTVNFRLTDAGRVETDITRSQRLKDVIQQCAAKANLNVGGIIAIRNGSVIQENDMVENGDEIDVFPAISGG